MIRKVIFQGIVTSLLFIASWFALMQISWMQVLKVENKKRNLEEKLGEIFTDVFRNEESELVNDFVLITIDSLLSEICTRNGLIKSDIKLHILESGEVNAFALPDGHLIINTGIIEASDNQEELCGVICHELAHIEEDHVMKKLVKEIGLNMLVSMTAGGGGTETVRNAAGMLSSTAYDRNLESEADRKAVEYLIAAGIDTEPFASLLYMMSAKDNTSIGLSWISTHPDPEERAKKILEYCSNQISDTEKIITENTWLRLKEELSRMILTAQ